VMKLLWDAIGTEFGGRHELYEMNYAGNHEDIRIQAMWGARTSGALDGMIALAERCLAEYDENAGWAETGSIPTMLPIRVCRVTPRGGVKRGIAVGLTLVRAVVRSQQRYSRAA